MPAHPTVNSLVNAINNGEMSTTWHFILSGDKISRIETGQAG